MDGDIKQANCKQAGLGWQLQMPVGGGILGAESSSKELRCGSLDERQQLRGGPVHLRQARLPVRTAHPQLGQVRERERRHPSAEPYEFLLFEVLGATCNSFEDGRGGRVNN